MADDVKKTYSEEEHTAILADRVTKETAEITAKHDQLQSQVTDLTTKLDTADSARLAAEQAAEKAAQELADFKAQVEEREAAAQRADTRVEEIKTKLPHLDEEWFKAEGRMDRIVAMKDDDFTSYVTDLASSAPAGDGATREVPRETAMKGEQPGGTPKVSAGRSFILHRYEGTGA